MSCDMILQREKGAEANSTKEAVYSHAIAWGTLFRQRNFSFQDTIPTKEFFFPGYNKTKAKGWEEKSA